MEPRLSSSMKWTPVPEELTEQIIDVFNKNFKAQVQSGDFHAEGRIFTKELLLRVGYKKEGEIRSYNFEVSIEFDPKKENAIKLLYTAVDCAASMMDEFFKNEEFHEFPKSWQPHKVDKKEVFLQTSTFNKELEEEADRLLGMEKEDTLVSEDDDL